MKQRAFLLVAATAILAGCIPPQPETPYPSLRLTEPKTGAGYTLYVPSYYTKDQAWPLVVPLHGTFGFDDPDLEVTAWKDAAERYGLIVAAPRLRSTQGILPVAMDAWMKDLETDEKSILAVVDEVCVRYNIAVIEEKPLPPPKGAPGAKSRPAAATGPFSRKAILLTGFSAGGYPLWFTGLRNPQRFHMLIGMGANSSPDIFAKAPVRPELGLLHVAIVVGADDVPKVQSESWRAYAWLRSSEVRCFHTDRREVKGGHLRRPDFQYELWSHFLPGRGKR